jgi:hypothetical protein
MVHEREMATYQRELPNLLDREGKWVLIRGDEVLGVWDGFGDVLKAGYERCGLGNFFVKQILKHEKPGWFPGVVVQCPP